MYGYAGDLVQAWDARMDSWQLNRRQPWWQQRLKERKNKLEAAVTATEETTTVAAAASATVEAATVAAVTTTVEAATVIGKTFDLGEPRGRSSVTAATATAEATTEAASTATEEVTITAAATGTEEETITAAVTATEETLKLGEPRGRSSDKLLATAVAWTPTTVAGRIQQWKARAVMRPGKGKLL